MEPKSAFITANGIKIHFERTGGDKPPLILCHGITDNGRCMLRLGEHLSSNFDVILLDARGHGKSDKPEKGYSADHHAMDVKGVIDGLNLTQPILYGHSMGARTVMRFGSRFPNIPRAIILEDPVYIIPPNEQEILERDIWLHQMRDAATRWKRMSLDEHLFIAQQQGHKDWTQDEQLEWAKSKFHVSPQVFDIALSMENINQDFPKILCPVLILKADADDETKEKEKEAVGLIPYGKIIHIKGTGHNIRRDDFFATIFHVEKFLNIIPN
jgi:pimeloyl-ACP methyl ester carboxylesterase